MRYDIYIYIYVIRRLKVNSFVQTQLFLELQYPIAHIQITRPEKSYLLRCVIVCDLETSLMRKPCFTGAVAPETNKQANIFQ